MPEAEADAMAQMVQVRQLLAAQADTMNELRRELVEANRKIAENEGRDRAGGNIKLQPASLGPYESIVLSLSLGQANLTLNISEILSRHMRSATLSAGTNLTLSLFVDCILVLLDKVSAETLNSHITNYTSANERNDEDALSTDFKRNGDWEIATYRQELFPKFIRFVIKYLFTEEIQEVVLQQNATYIVKQDCSQTIPTAIIRRLEEYRLCSAGARPERVLTRGSVYTALKTILQRASTRHMQTLSLCLAVMQGTYHEVEHMADGRINIGAEASHVSKLASIGKILDTQFHSMSTLSPAGTMHIHNTAVSHFPDQAVTANMGSSANFNSVMNLPASNKNGYLQDSSYARGLSFANPTIPSLTGTGGPTLEAIPDHLRSLSHTVEAVSEKVDNLTHKINSLDMLDDDSDEEEEPVMVNALQYGKDLFYDDVLTVATACDIPTATIMAISQRTRKRTPIDQITCFFCKETGHYKSNCPKLNSSSRGRARSRTNHFNPSAPGRMPGRPFSSVFRKTRDYNGKKGFTGKQLQRPNNKYRAFGRYRNKETGGGYKIQPISATADVEGLPEDADIFFCEATVEKVTPDTTLFFDLA